MKTSLYWEKNLPNQIFASIYYDINDEYISIFMKDGFNQFYDEMKPYLSSHSPGQYSSGKLLSQINLSGDIRILDLGCGTGKSIDVDSLSRKINGTISLIGLDISNNNENSYLSHIRYDGTRFPFKNSSFDIIFCNQVLEHVRYPDTVINEVARTIKDNGYFIGSVSHTEPYHANSIFNWTPYGLVQVFTLAGFEKIQIFPGIDSMTLLFRRLTLGVFGNFFFSHQSPLNILLRGMGMILNFSHQKTSAVMLCLCGQFSFCAKKRRDSQ